MAQEKNEFLDESGLQSVINKFVALFAKITHTHELSEISDYTVDSSLSSTSTNPVQNKIITVEINRINETLSGTAYIDVEDNENIEYPDISTSDNIVDSALSETSANPIQNSVITNELNRIMYEINSLKQTGVGGTSTSYDETTGNLTINSSSSSYDEVTGNLTI